MFKHKPWTPLVLHRTTPAPHTALIATVVIAVAVIATGSLITLRGPQIIIPVSPELSLPSVAPSTSASVIPDVVATVTPSTPSLREGYDYSFIQKHNGEPVRWACATSITVALHGDVPAGTAIALENAVAVLEDASGLPLTITAPNTPAKITVAYGPHGSSLGNLDLTGDELGVGGPVFREAEIISGAVLIRDDRPSTDPTTAIGQATLAHELAHALGLGHAAQDAAQIMSPTLTAGSVPTLGPGDRAALAHLGC